MNFRRTLRRTPIPKPDNIRIDKDGLYTKTCLTCGIVFTTNNWRYDFHSKACADDSPRLLPSKRISRRNE